ncbi:MAG: hypothetical protein AAB131_21680 [Actinomycetota bacterium]
MSSVGWTCAFCGNAVTADDASASSFLFLARSPDGFHVAQQWEDESEHLEGHQFFCHAACFKDRMNPMLLRAVFDPNF